MDPRLRYAYDLVKYGDPFNMLDFLDLFDLSRKEIEPVFWSTFFMDKSVTYLALLLWALQVEVSRFFLLLDTSLTRVE